MNLTRHKIRELAFQTLFAIEANSATDKEMFFYALTKMHEDEEIPQYFNVIVDGVLEHKSELDSLISKHLSSGWSIQRIAKTDLIVLRIAFFEAKYVENVPANVAINEALEITKKYSDDRSRKFVNGVLANIVSNV